MKKILSGYSLVIALFASGVIAPIAVDAGSSKRENSGLAELAKIDKPVFVFKTTAKDPYSLVYRPGSNTLEILLFGYYSGAGSRVFHVTKPEKQLNKLMPIRWTKFFMDGSTPVKIDEKYPGYRESTLGNAFADVLMATSILSEHYYKGTPFVDQYLNAMPFKLVFNKVEEVTALRSLLQPLFEKHELLSKCHVKPVLVIEIDGTDQILSQGDSDFFKTYFTVCDETNEEVKAFFGLQQDAMERIFVRSKDAKQVKEAFADIVFRQFESLVSEFKMKEAGAAALSVVIAAVTYDIAKGYVGDITKNAKAHVHKNAIDPLIKNLNSADAATGNGLLLMGGILGAGILAAGTASVVTE
jgi:hypothetical protein